MSSIEELDTEELKQLLRYLMAFVWEVGVEGKTISEELRGDLLFLAQKSDDIYESLEGAAFIDQLHSTEWSRFSQTFSTGEKDNWTVEGVLEELRERSKNRKSLTR